MQDLKITIIQTDLVWENREKNLERFEDKINAVKEDIDLIALPEMFSTGFVVDPTRIAEGMEGPTFYWPAARSYAWESLLAARAIEYMAYVIGMPLTSTLNNLNLYSFSFYLYLIIYSQIR